MTLADLIACGIAPTQARAFAEPLSAAMLEHGITTPARRAAFVAQCAHESARFTALEEGLYYTTPAALTRAFGARVGRPPNASLLRNPQRLANRVYALRNGNGDEASGDGWRFRGRGLIQLTGRGNYRAADWALCGGTPAQPGEIMRDPGCVALPAMAARTAAWYWRSHGCNELADAGRWDDITRAVNGRAMLKADERRAQTLAALRVLSGDTRTA